MNKITAEEALEIIRHNITQAYIYACYNKSTKHNTRTLEEQTHRMVDMLSEQLTPTLDEVVKAWEGNGYIVVPDGERIYFNRNGYEIEFKIKEIEYEYDGFITLELHKLINLTIRYLESQKE